MHLKDIQKQRQNVNLFLFDRKINNALAILTGWVAKLVNTDKKQTFLLEIEAIKSNYFYVFQYFLTFEDDSRDDILDDLTRKTYDLSDTMYAEMLTTFNFVHVPFNQMPDNDNDVMIYLSQKLQLTEQDFYQIQRAKNDKNNLRTLSILSGIALNLRHNFSSKLLTLLLDFQKTDDSAIQNFSLVLTIFIFALYDDRIDFYPELQDLFENQLDEIDREVAFEVLLTLLGFFKNNAETLFKSFMQTGLAKEVDEAVQAEFASSPLKMDKPIKYVFEHILDTWVADCIIDENPSRSERIEKEAICVGQIGYFGGSVEEAEKVVLQRLRGNQTKPYDYIHYAHCCLIRGDRALAVEFYKKARLQCSYQEFCKIFDDGLPFLLNNEISSPIIELIVDQMKDVDS